MPKPQRTKAVNSGLESPEGERELACIFAHAPCPKREAKRATRTPTLDRFHALRRELLALFEDCAGSPSTPTVFGVHLASLKISRVADLLLAEQRPSEP